MRQYSAQKQEKLIWSKNGEVRACTPEHTLFPRTGLPYRVSSAGGGSELFVGLGAAVQLCCCRSRSSQRSLHTAATATWSDAVAVSVRGRRRHLESWGPVRLAAPAEVWAQPSGTSNSGLRCWVQDLDTQYPIGKWKLILSYFPPRGPQWVKYPGEICI